MGPIPVVGLQPSLQAVTLERDSVTCSRASRAFVAEQGTPEDSLQGFSSFPFIFLLAVKTSRPSAKGPFPHSQ